MAYPKLSLGVAPKQPSRQLTRAAWGHDRGRHGPWDTTRLRNKVKKLDYSSMNVHGFDAIEPHSVNPTGRGYPTTTGKGILEGRAGILPRYPHKTELL
jgi:hypothetical protein